MKRSLLPLNALRAFDAAARNLSFKEAARELSVTPAAISQQIRTLEDTLGVELFKRTSRSLILSEQAQLAMPALQDAFQKIESAVEIMQADQSSNELRISVSHSFATKWLVPRLDSYYSQHPDSIIKIDASLSITDFHTEDVDLAIRYGAGGYDGLFEEIVLRETIFPVCSPAVADTIKTPEDLLQFTLIHDDSFTEDISAPSWTMWFKALGIDQPDGHAALHLNTNYMAVDAAIGGRGVALARSAIAAEDIKAGRLVRPLCHDTPVNFAHHVVCPEAHLRRPKVQQFIDWLRQEVAQS